MSVEDEPVVTADGTTMLVRGRFYHLTPGRAVDCVAERRTPVEECVDKHADSIVAAIWRREA